MFTVLGGDLIRAGCRQVANA